MRSLFTAVLTGTFFLCLPAMAGTISMANGTVAWQSTQCTAPVAPPSLLSADHMSAAEDMNTRVTQYNQYAVQVQSYLDCLGNEAQTDANATAQAVVASAKGRMDEVQANLRMLGAPLQPKQ